MQVYKQSLRRNMIYDCFKILFKIFFGNWMQFGQMKDSHWLSGSFPKKVKYRNLNC